MPNTLAPNGFQYFGRLSGAQSAEAYATRFISSSDANAVGYGDPVTSLNTGFVTLSTAGTTQIAGIFYGCEYLSTALGRVVWSPNWPGSGATGNVTAHICTDPDAMFTAQAATGPYTLADVGNNVQFTIGTPNSATGLSTSSVSGASATTNTLPFRIVGLLSDFVSPSQANGTDNTSANNVVIVAANNWDRKSLLGI